MARLSEADPIAFEEQVAIYLDKNEVYDLFEDLIRELALRRPDDPVDFLIKKLKSSQKMRVFAFGSTEQKATITCAAAATEAGLVHIKASEVGISLDHKSGSFDKDLSDKLYAIIEELESDPANSGYLIEGFPQNRAQGRCMQQTWKIIPSRVIYLNDASHHHNNYQFPAVVELFRYVVSEIDLDDETALSQLISCVSLKPMSNAPTRPHRICIFGQHATAQAALLAQQYGLVHVRAETLGNDLTDEVVQRLGHDDCRSRGWVLDGFPVDDAQALRNGPHYTCPSRVIVIGEGEFGDFPVSRVDSASELQSQIQRILDHPLQ